MLKHEVNSCFEKSLDRLIYAALFVLALGLVTSTSILALSHILMVLPCLYFATITDWKKLPKSAWALLGFSGVIIISVIVNQDIMIKGWKPIFKVKYFIFGFFSIVPIHWWLKNKLNGKRKKILIYTFLLSTTLATIVGTIALYTDFNYLLMKPPLFKGRNSGLFGMVMNYAHNLSFFLIILFGLIINKTFEKIISQKTLIIILTINVLGLYFSYTRGAWIALAAGIPFYFLKNNKKQFIVAITVILILCTLGYFAAGKNVTRAYSDDQRMSQWKAAYKAFEERPILGYGYLNFEDHSVRLKQKYGYGQLVLASHAHNNFMEVLASLGFAGIVFYIIWLVLWLIEGERRFTLSFLATFVAGGMTQSTIALGVNLFFIISAYVSLTNIKRVTG